MKNATRNFFLFLLLSSYAIVSTGQTLVCNATVNISLDSSGSSTITPAMVLEGSYDFSVLEVMPATLTTSDIGTVQYTVTSSLTGNTCWGQLIVSDLSNGGGSNANMACFDQISLSLNGQNSTVVTPQMVLAGGPYDFSEITVEPSVVTTANLGSVNYTATASNGNLCWGALNISENLIVHPVVHLSLDGQNKIDLSPSTFLAGTHSDYTTFTISPESVSAADLGGLVYTITNVQTGETASGQLQLCATTTELTCMKAIVNLGTTGMNTFEIDHAAATWDDSCNPGGYSLSFSDEENNVVEIDVTCADLTMSGEYQIYLWNGNNLVDECTALYQVLDPFGVCTGTTNLVCNDFVNVSVDPWKCSAGISPALLLEGNFVASEIELSETELGLGEHIVTATHLPTGNICWGTIKVEDKTPPVPVVHSKIEVKLNFSTSSPSGRVYAELIDNGSYDSCTAVTFSPEYWTFGCDDIGTQIVELTVTDSYGNSNKTWTEVVIKSDQQFVFTCPEDIVVSCSTDINEDSVIENKLGGYPLTDVGCSGASASYHDIVTNDLNGDGAYDGEVIGPDGVTYDEERFCGTQLVRRTWSLEPESCEQLIFLKFDSDVISEADIVWPENEEHTCPGTPFQVPTWPGIACEQLISSVESDSLYFDSDACLKIINKWTVLNWCTAEAYEHISIVRIIKDISPSLDVSNAQVGGASNNRFISATAGSLCSSEELKWEVTVDIDADWSVDFEISSFSPEDDLGALWDDDDGNGIPDVRVGNTGDVDNASSDSVLQGTTYSFQLPDFVSAVEGVQHRVVWSVTDGCGNRSSVTSYFQVSPFSEDIEAPKPFCVNVNTAIADPVEGLELYAIDFNAGSFDDVTTNDNLRYTFSDLSPGLDPSYDLYGTGIKSSVKKYYLDGQSSKSITEDIHVWDEAGNSDFCRVTIRLVENEDQLDFLPVDLCFPNKFVVPGEEVCLPLTATNFNSVSSFDGSIVWDSDVLEYKRIDSKVLEMGPTSLSADNAELGYIAFSWFDFTAIAPVTASDGEALFEVCFDVVGDSGEIASVGLTNTPTATVVASAGDSPFDPLVSRIITTKAGKVEVNDDACEVEIIWPVPTLEVYLNDLSSESAISAAIAPSNLNTMLGFSDSEVMPIFQSACLVGWNHEDLILPLSNGDYKIIRTFQVINWNTGESYEFVQIIKVLKSDSFICDFLPNDAPLGDCASGHTNTDDVEWPADIEIFDHRISPEQLVEHAGVDTKNAEPQFFNSPSLYSFKYEDLLDDLTTEFLSIDREWTVTRISSPGYVWTYTQSITIDLVELTNLVSVTTHGNRPIPNVRVVDQIKTDEEGTAIVDANVELDLHYDDTDLNGLNIKDLILMRNHILGLSDLSPVQDFAGDMDNSGGVSTLDWAILNNFLLEADWQPEMSWKFLDEYELATVNGDPSPVVVGTKGQFTGIKPGDIDDTAAFSNLPPTDPKVELRYEDVVMNAGQTYSVPFVLDEEHSVWGFSERFFYDSELVEVVGVSSPLFDNLVQFGIVEQSLDKEVRIMSTAQAGQYQELPAQSELFTIEIRALENTVLSTALNKLTLNNDPYSVLVKDDGLDIFRLNTELGGMIGSSVLDLDGYSLKVYPNPADDEINLEFSQDQITDFRFKIYDATGKVVIAAVNQHKVDVTALSNGYYFYSIEMGDKLYSDRLVIQR